MIVSLAEINAMAKRATLGCGHFWGITEEMAYAIPWLCARGFDATSELVNALENHQESEYEIIERAAELQLMNHERMPLPALTLAPSAADLLVVNRVPAKAVTMSLCSNPLLLLPFLAQVAVTSGEAVSLIYATQKGDFTVINFEGDDLWVYSASKKILTVAQGQQVSLNWGISKTDIPLLYSPEQFRAKYRETIAGGCHLDGNIWKKLQTFAHNAYVPSSAESRMTGAGAGLLDND